MQNADQVNAMEPVGNVLRRLPIYEFLELRNKIETMTKEERHEEFKRIYKRQQYLNEHGTIADQKEYQYNAAMLAGFATFVRSV